MFQHLNAFERLTFMAYFGVLFLLAVYGFHRSKLLFLLWKNKAKPLTPSSAFEHLPAVTIQLPIFNEANVVRRLIQSAAKIDYPKQKIEIQVLDDSTDETKSIACEEIARVRETGVNIVHLRRENRLGFKAGALEEGMQKASGDFLLILDADFVAQPSLLKELIHYFTDPQVAMVQARWEYFNANQSALTQSQAMLLNGHFKIEHEARFRASLFFNFNGTAGIWRKSAIEDAGGWEHDTITEDTDLSYRAQMRGWKMCYVDSVGVPSELPANINAFKGQQRRWAKGLMQTARKILPLLFRMNLPFRIKSEAFFHLTNNMSAVCLLGLVLLQMPNLYLRAHHDSSLLLLFDVPLFGGTFFSIASFYLTAHTRTGQKFWKGLLHLPHMMALGIGLSVNNAFAALSGLWSTDAVFVRTPKEGDISLSETLTKKYHAPISFAVMIELSLAVYLTWTLVLAIQHRMWVYLPFLVLFIWGYLEVAFRSLLKK